MFNNNCCIGRRANIIELVKLFIGNNDLYYSDIETIFNDGMEKTKSWLKSDADLEDVRLEFLVAAVVNYNYTKLTKTSDMDKADKLLKDYADLCKTFLKDNIRAELGV